MRVNRYLTPKGKHTSLKTGFGFPATNISCYLKETTNELSQPYFPKRVDFSTITDEDIKKTETILTNSRQGFMLEIKAATIDDVPLIFSFIKKLAEYEKLSHEVVATEDGLREVLFGAHRYAETVIAYSNNEPVGFALFFHNFSTFVGKPGIYLEDLFVDPIHRGKGYGKALLAFLAKLASERNCGRLEWAVLDWNQPSIEFYESLGAKPMREWTVYRLTGEALESLANG